MSFSDALQDRLAPWLTPATDPFGDHANFLTAVAAMGAVLWDLVMDQGDDPDDPSWVPGWGALFDVSLCPTAYLPFLGQLVGVPPSALLGADDATARSIIRNEAGQQRGTPAAVIAAAQRFLSGTQSCILLERTNGTTADAYAAVLIVRPEECASLAALENAVSLVKPAGIVIYYVESDNYTWASAIHDWSTDTMTWASTASVQP